MPATANAKVFPSQFVRRTTLEPDERRINFHQLDHDVIAAVSSDEAASVTDKMAKIYLRLVTAPNYFWQAPGVLCFPGERRGDEWLTGYDQLIELLGVSPATAAKALTWMKEKAIIGYHSPKNGHPTRIWLNRAAGSIDKKATSAKTDLRLVEPGETASSTAKNFAPAASDFSAAASNFEPAFKEEDPRSSSRVGSAPAAADSLAPCGGETVAEEAPAEQSAPAPAVAPQSAAPRLTLAPAANPAVAPAPAAQPLTQAPAQPLTQAPAQAPAQAFAVQQSEATALAAQIGGLAAQLALLRAEVAQKPSAGSLLGSVSAAVRAELNDQLEFQFAFTREWLKNKALPQVARVSQSETCKLLRSLGLFKSREAERAAAYVGASPSVVQNAAPAKATTAAANNATPPLLTEQEVLNAAEAVRVLAGVRQISLEESLQRVLADSQAADPRTQAPQFAQALRELVFGEAVDEHWRRQS